MSDRSSQSPPDVVALQAEVARQAKIIRVLMDRAEQSTSSEGSDYGTFQTTLMLEQEVRRRTVELRAALRENEAIHKILFESEAKFRGVVSQSLVGIATIEGGRFTYSNAKFEEIFGYDSEAVAQIDDLALMVEPDVPALGPLRRWIIGETATVDCVFPGIRADGSVVHVECRGSAVDIDGSRLLITTVMDITERVHAEHEVQALQERLKAQATRDALTGLHNRHYLEETLSRELIRAEREEIPVSLIIADLDHFKSVNDTHGHLVGDEALREFSAIVKRNARGSDILCRYGGEEFLLVFPGMAEVTALERAEHLRAEWAATLVTAGDGAISLTASFGVATLPQHGQEADELIAAADAALYVAKESGRNRVVLADSVATVPQA